MSLVVPIVLAIFGSSGFWSYLQSKKDKSKAILDSIDKVNTEVKIIKTDLTKLKADIDETEAKNARNRIVRFADDIRIGKQASKDYYDHILKDCDLYEDYCKDHPKFENNIAVISMKKIKEHYEQDDFL